MIRESSSTGTTCIIPFFNESSRITSVLRKVTAIPSISQVICVDDDSTDNASTLIARQFPQVTLIRHVSNSGKTAAIHTGLPYALHPHILLLDADLVELNQEKLQRGVETFLNHPEIDMLILMCQNDPLAYRIMRTHIVISGQRLLKKRDLEKILRRSIHSYQLELGINQYMIDHRKRVYWFPIEYQHRPKMSKYGLIQGVAKEVEMGMNVINYQGFQYYLRSLVTFCPHSIEKNELLKHTPPPYDIIPIPSIINIFKKWWKEGTL